MVYFEARSIAMHLANAAAGLGLSVLVAFIGLNAVTGCGQGGSCVGPGDLTAPPAPLLLADNGVALVR